jgi:hypothetical protein
MIRQRILSFFIFTTASLLLVALIFNGRSASVAAQAAADSGGGNDVVARQIEALQKQIVELQGQVKELKSSPRIIAAGTVTIRLGPQQDNKTSIRVKLPADVVARLGGNCIVQLTNRYPAGDTYFVPYSRLATDGFDILLADPSLEGVQINPNRTIPYYVDWIVVEK